MSSQPALKRLRSDSIPSEEPIGVNRSDFWKDDGNVILQAGRTQFRVHRSMLSDNSPVFKNLFAMSMPNAKDCVEGIPVIHIMDRPDDMLHVLRALYERNYFHASEEQPLSIVAALLRLGDKYNIKVLYHEAIRILHTGALLTSSTPSEMGLFSKLKGKEDLGFYVDLANLLREHQIYTVLPLALVLLVDTKNKKNLFQGIKRTDGTCATLHPENLEVAINGLHRLLSDIQEYMYTWATATRYCLSEGCLQHQMDYLMLCFNYGFYHYVDELFVPWQEDWSKGFCAECQEAAQQYYEAGRGKVWRSIPSYFNVNHSWEELQDQLAAMLQ